MKKIFFPTLILSIFLMIIIAGCDSSDNSGEEIDVELIEAESEPPAKIRLFFKVDLGEENQFTTLDPSAFEIFEDGSQISRLESQADIQREPGDFLYSSGTGRLFVFIGINA